MNAHEAPERDHRFAVHHPDMVSGRELKRFFQQRAEVGQRGFITLAAALA